LHGGEKKRGIINKTMYIIEDAADRGKHRSIVTGGREGYHGPALQDFHKSRLKRGDPTKTRKDGYLVAKEGEIKADLVGGPGRRKKEQHGEVTLHLKSTDQVLRRKCVYPLRNLGEKKGESERKRSMSAAEKDLGLQKRTLSTVPESNVTDKGGGDLRPNGKKNEQESLGGRKNGWHGGRPHVNQRRKVPTQPPKH